MSAALPVYSLAVYRRAIDLLQAQGGSFVIHPLRILLGLRLGRERIPTLSSGEPGPAGQLSEALYSVFGKAPPYEEGRGTNAFLKLFEAVSLPADNDWRNAFNSQKGLGCFATPAELLDPAFRHAQRTECPHRRLGRDGDQCDLSPAGQTRCRSVEEHAGEVPKLLRQTQASGSGGYRYQLVEPTGPDLAKFRRGEARLAVWPLIGSLYPGNAELRSGRGVISYEDLLGDLGLSRRDADELFDLSSTMRPNNMLAQMTEPYLLASVRQSLLDRGFMCSFPDLINFYLSLKPRGFVILTGISGTGKSMLPRLFADVIRPRDSMSSANFEAVPVRPGWNDVSDLLGFYNSIHEGFEPGPAIRAFRKALDNESDSGAQATFLLLDELNLARVEHYFADFLSVMESRRPDRNGRWVTDPLRLAGGRTGVVPFVGVKEPTTDFVDQIPAEFSLPDNLFLIGTVNVDETTQGISNKVLDRANTIEFEEVHFEPIQPTTTLADYRTAPVELLASYLVERPYRTYDAAVTSRPEIVRDRTGGRLKRLYDELFKWRVHFGTRTRDEVSIYMAYAADFSEQASLAGIDLEGFDLDAALDRQILQKVLPRIGGTREELQHAAAGNLFDQIEPLLEEWNCSLSLDKLHRMKSQEIINFWEA